MQLHGVHYPGSTSGTNPVWKLQFSHSQTWFPRTERVLASFLNKEQRPRE
jgi:hypothetical protein